MSYYNNSNAAYDFERFAPKEEVEEEKIQTPKLVKKKKVAQKSLVDRAMVVKFIVVGLFAMISIGCIMVGNVKMTQLSDEISSARTELNRVDSEKISLNSKLESRMSLTKVENYATANLGLVKTQPYQLQYVNFTDKDNVQLKDSSNFITKAFADLINNIKAYFN